MSISKNRIYICMWDCNGFESITDFTDWNKQCFLDMMVGKEPSNPPVSLHALVLRAQYNPQRNPEIWSLTTTEDLDEKTLWGYAEDDPQGLADLIRERGKCLYRRPMKDPVIK